MGLLWDHVSEEDDQDVFEVEAEAATPKLKLSLFSLPKKPPEVSGMLTPPLQTPASVPFQWEEAPGRPRPFCTRSFPKPSTARCLELPPRLLKEAKITSMPSPTTVLDGPYVGRSWSHRRGGSFRTHDDGSNKVLFFGSNRWAPLMEKGVKDDDPFSILEEGGSASAGQPNVKITRVKRRGSLLNLSYSKSHLWARIYKSIRQVVPWRRRCSHAVTAHVAASDWLDLSPLLVKNVTSYNLTSEIQSPQAAIDVGALTTVLLLKQAAVNRKRWRVRLCLPI
ncbi:hypothetical protein SAY87_008201 [Trapa incisa]|uniref:Uncharacterized protein n=1 Tax=Trapa incisa TaxID=236973 RepID=A0AAN7KJY7_9MYRT|nr:hypothetical protein SAY87_008201 [Trapa incisa]